MNAVMLASGSSRSLDLFRHLRPRLLAVGAAGCLRERDVGHRDDRLATKDARQVLARGRSGRGGDLLRRARDDDLAASSAALRTQIDDPVGTS